ncbi:hypothetical protein ABT330_19280 [Streptomyces sp. NPDC000658]|uniref:hypothetical protein n=1 Tax=Streptomyces sp. NPDC000658 TaxID=3154266 RepID=UPI0033180F28
MNAWNQQGGQPPYDPYHPYGPYGPQPIPPPVRRVGPVRRMWRAVGPLAAGRKVFRPSRPGRVDDPAVARMQRIRTAVGLAAVVWVTFSYKLAASVADLADDRLDQSWNAVLVLW